MYRAWVSEFRAYERFVGDIPVSSSLGFSLSDTVTISPSILVSVRIGMGSQRPVLVAV